MSLDFTTSAGLRMLLTELHYAGEAGWRHDPDAAALMEYAADKYSALAHKHGLTREDAAYAAFDVLRTSAVRTAYDPWAVTTRGVQLSLIYEERANGLLCSTHQARRAEVSANHDAERFGDHETSLLDYHPAFHVPAEVDGLDDEGMASEETQCEPVISTAEAFAMTVSLYIALGWPHHVITHAISIVSARLMDAGNRVTAHEGLRKDQVARRALDLTQTAWSALLTTVLGNPRQEWEHTNTGRGIWWRLLVGEPVMDLLADDRIVQTISETAPTLDPLPRVKEVLDHVA